MFKNNAQLLYSGVPGAATGFLIGRASRVVALGIGLSTFVLLYSTYRSDSLSDISLSGYVKMSRSNKDKLRKRFLIQVEQLETKTEVLHDLEGEIESHLLPFIETHALALGGFAAGVLVGFAFS